MQLLRLYAVLSGSQSLWKLISMKVNFKNNAKDAIPSLMNSLWMEKAPYAAMTHTDTRSSSYLHECAHTAATLDKLVRNWASGESLTLSMQLGPRDRSYTLNSVDSKESNLWLSQSGLIRSVQLNVFGSGFCYKSAKPWLTQTMIIFLSNVEEHSLMLFVHVALHLIGLLLPHLGWTTIDFYDICSFWGVGGQLFYARCLLEQIEANLLFHMIS